MGAQAKEIRDQDNRRTHSDMLGLIVPIIVASLLAMILSAITG